MYQRTGFADVCLQNYTSVRSLLLLVSLVFHSSYKQLVVVFYFHLIVSDSQKLSGQVPRVSLARFWKWLITAFFLGLKKNDWSEVTLFFFFYFFFSVSFNCKSPRVTKESGRLKFE